MNQKYEKLEEIDVVRKEGNKIHILGRSGPYMNHETPSGVVHELGKYLHHITYDPSSYRFIDKISFKRNEGRLFRLGQLLSFLGIGVPLLFYQSLPKAVENRNGTAWYWNKVKTFQEENMEDLKEAIKDIKIYQGIIEEVSRELGVELKRVDTGKPETFVQEKDSFWLRVKAHLLGADAVVHYQPGSAVGTPVKWTGYGRPLIPKK